MGLVHFQDAVDVVVLRFYLITVIIMILTAACDL